MSDEERRFTRIPFNVHTRLKTKDAVYTTNQISNISIGGCLLPIASDLVPGTPCTVMIRLEEGTDEVLVRIKGEILRTYSHAVAVKFLLIDTDSLYHLQNIIRYNAEDPDRIDEEISRHPGLI